MHHSEKDSLQELSLNDMNKFFFINMSTDVVAKIFGKFHIF